MFNTTPYRILEELGRTPANQELWESLIEHYAEPLFRHVKHSYKLSNFDSEEVVVDTLAYLYEKIKAKQFEPDQSRENTFRSYLKKSAWFSVSNKTRKRRKETTIEPRFVADILQSSIKSVEKYEIELVAFRELNEKYNEDERWAVFKAVKSGEKRKDVCAHFNLSDSTVYRIVKHFQELCAEYLEQKANEHC